MELGTADASHGERARGWLSVTDHPTGGSERLPVVIVEGARKGPTLWLTGGVHGDEATGVAVALDAVEAVDPRKLSGTIACIPVVNPAGLRRNARASYYNDEDPNRFFPDPAAESAAPAEVQHRIDEQVYEAIANTADVMIDLHTATVGSMPFAIRDRVLYGTHRSEAEATELATQLETLIDAFGHPSVTEYQAAEYLEEGLQRSTAGAVLNTAGIPAFTAELGGHSVVTEELRAGGVAGVHGVARELGMLDSLPEDVDPPAEIVTDSPVDFRVRRERGPRTDTAGLVRHRLGAGEVFSEGDPLVDVVSPTGDHLETVTADGDGYVIGRAEGLASYEGDPIASTAIRDETDLVAKRDD